MDMKRILQAMDGVSSRPAGDANDMKKFLQIVNEGTNPHKVSLPVQMAMQHYQEVKAAPAVKEDKLFRIPETNKLYKYYQVEEKRVTERTQARREQIAETARSIAKRVLEKNKLDEISNFKRREIEHELHDEDHGQYYVVIAKNGKWEKTKAQPGPGMNAAFELVDRLHNKYPHMHLGVYDPFHKSVHNMGKKG